MRRSMPFRKSDFLYLWIAASLLLVQSAYCIPAPVGPEQESSQQQQQSSQSQQQPTQQQQSAQQSAIPATSPQSEPKRRKVWTNEDVISLRTPADVYLADKAAQETAAAEAASKEAAEAKLVKVAGPTEKLPATVAETHKLIAAKQNQIVNDQEALDRYTAELPNEPPEHKDRMQSEIERITSDLPKERLELQVLKDHLDSLNKAQLKEGPIAPSSPPPS